MKTEMKGLYAGRSQQCALMQVCNIDLKNEKINMAKNGIK